MGRRNKTKKIAPQRRPEAPLSDAIETLYEAHVNSKICVHEGCENPWTKRGVCDEHHNQLFGQKLRVQDEAIARGEDPKAAAERFDDECVRDGLLFPRKFRVNPFAKKRRELARKAAETAVQS